MKHYFNTHNNTNVNQIAIVTADVDVNSFRHDSNWYEMTEKEYQAALQPTVKQTKKAVKPDEE